MIQPMLTAAGRLHQVVRVLLADLDGPLDPFPCTCWREMYSSACFTPCCHTVP